MKIIVMSGTSDFPNEHREVIKMFELGLEYFHVRKPRKSKIEIAQYIQQFPIKWRKQLVLHSYHELAETYQTGGIHLSRAHRTRGKYYQFKLWWKRRRNPNFVVTRTFHKITDVINDKRAYSYAFLSPVYDSHSQTTLSAGFSIRALHIVLPQARQPIIALGGVMIENLKKSFDNGFHGAVFHGSIWEEGKSPSETFQKAIQLIAQFSQI